jgi:RNase P/RNase MRP subunit p29
MNDNLKKQKCQVRQKVGSYYISRTGTVLKETSKTVVVQLDSLTGVKLPASIVKVHKRNVYFL